MIGKGHGCEFWEVYAQFSVTIGFTSRTTTVTLRTAKVFASSSPIPEAPV